MEDFLKQSLLQFLKEFVNGFPKKSLEGFLKDFPGNFSKKKMQGGITKQIYGRFSEGMFGKISRKNL